MFSVNKMSKQGTEDVLGFSRSDLAPISMLSSDRANIKVN